MHGHRFSWWRGFYTQNEDRDLPGTTVVNTLHFHCRGAASIPGWRTKILHAVRYDQKKSLKKIFFLMKERQNSRRF